MIFVTGGTGMLGAHLLFELVQVNPIIRATKRASSDLNATKKIFSFYTNKSDELFDKIEWVDVDLLEYYSIQGALDGVTKVYHCAAMISFNKKDRKKMIENNVTGTANLVNACLNNNIQKLIHVSSIAALGRAKIGEMTTEKTPWKDNNKDSPYSFSKYQSELEVWRGIAEGLNAVIINPSVILGPGDWTKGSPSFFRLIDKGMKYYSEGMNGYVYVRDVSRAMIQLMTSDISGERYIINGEDLTYLELFNMMAKTLGKEYPRIEAKKWMMDIAWRGAWLKGFFTGRTPEFTKSNAKSFLSSYNYSNEKLVNEIGFEYTSLQKTISSIGDIYLHDNR